MINVPLGSAPTGHMHTTDATFKRSTDDRYWSKNRYILQMKTFWPGSGIIYRGSCDQMVFPVYENISQVKNVFYLQ